MTDNTRKKIVRWFWILILAPIALVFVLLGIVWAFAEIPTIEELENPDSKLATQVIAEEGEILTTYHIENRTFVGYDELPLHLVQATPVSTAIPASTSPAFSASCSRRSCPATPARAAVPPSPSSWRRRSIPARSTPPSWT